MTCSSFSGTLCGSLSTPGTVMHAEMHHRYDESLLAQLEPKMKHNEGENNLSVKYVKRVKNVTRCRLWCHGATVSTFSLDDR
ncbi:hypothetical protein RRG08_038107 [Elysia crispata]|uniref:Uncharacterized protein n=1 Tax=Elysia crispata TaxID=231223 RepID=A0AAE0ZYF3_9GAST|nr:hypothetical protein RRG08_038107 [Elysia crispata]